MIQHYTVLYKVQIDDGLYPKLRSTQIMSRFTPNPAQDDERATIPLMLLDTGKNPRQLSGTIEF